MYTTLNKIAQHANMREVLNTFLKLNKRKVTVVEEIGLDEMCNVVGLSNTLKILPTVHGYNKQVFNYSFESIKSIKHLFDTPEQLNLYEELLEAYDKGIVPTKLYQLHLLAKPLVRKGLWCANGALYFITESDDFKKTAANVKAAVRTALQIADPTNNAEDEIDRELDRAFLEFVKKHKKQVQVPLFQS